MSEYTIQIPAESAPRYRECGAVLLAVEVDDPPITTCSNPPAVFHGWSEVMPLPDGSIRFSKPGYTTIEQSPVRPGDVIVCEAYADCEVCGNEPDEFGMIEHGRGCYVASDDGGEFSLADKYLVARRPVRTISAVRGEDLKCSHVEKLSGISAEDASCVAMGLKLVVAMWNTEHPETPWDPKSYYWYTEVGT